ncbi:MULTISPECIES: hypothetical protein [unclassified Rhodococcus (in: high G+C Gram-positive bacteria)]|uniref:hypothetical protein n=1 Tax=unclassified Rhodococcus (in: high G+C Gram-positive bacteria) TaxID=192944 RepID=UPI0006FDCA4E|nr:MULTISPECIES: hypothetical protein [unclassified Rhodococcus (in: high G+C Gram-positive bacteria)]KQU29461.1 hypothetical protein ASG69_07275 [Rhodococcus sp. Leaf225]KQU41077.1 hypothetical protein ASH03_19085 [Rhodococcus sp. Leaf258]
MSSSWFRRLAVTGSAVVGVLATSPGLASAHHQEFTPFPYNISLGRGMSLPCAGEVGGDVYTPHDRPGIAVVTLTWRTFVTDACPLAVYVNMNNTDAPRVDPYSGAKPTGGTWMVQLESAAIGTVPPAGRKWTEQIAIDIGSGRAGLTLTTDAPLNTTLLDPAGNTVRFTVA